MILDDIVKQKKLTLEKSEYQFEIEGFMKQYTEKKTASFRDAISKSGLSIIGEIKKASPSRGLIRTEFDPVALAREYEWAVDAISVLTEEHFFQGNNKYLKEVHKTVLLPLLRKDFIISPLQIFEAKELGASAVLLITAILEKNVLRDFIQLAKGLKLDALVEVHDERELETALETGAEIIGINNRNLYDFSEDINNTVRLKKKIPSDKLVVSESAIHTTHDIKILKNAGVNAILVGESFMKAADIKLKAREFRDAYGE